MIKVLGPGYPGCAYPGCKKHGEDGYCLASCCPPDHFGGLRAYCSEHSHRPTMLLEVLGYDPHLVSFTRADVEHIVKAMWVGAGMVFESQGYLLMLRQIKAQRAAAGQPTDGLDGIRRG